MNIKRVVRECLDKGMTDDEAYAFVKETAPPLRKVVRSYVDSIARDYRAEKSTDTGSVT